MVSAILVGIFLAITFGKAGYVNAAGINASTQVLMQIRSVIFAVKQLLLEHIMFFTEHIKAVIFQRDVLTDRVIIVNINTTQIRGNGSKKTIIWW